jgi:hypothetical protein
VKNATGTDNKNTIKGICPRYLNKKFPEASSDFLIVIGK